MKQIKPKIWAKVKDGWIFPILFYLSVMFFLPLRSLGKGRVYNCLRFSLLNKTVR